MKMKLPVLHKNKNTNTAIYVVILIVVIYAIYKIYEKVQAGRQEETMLQQSTSTGSTTPTTTTPKPAPVYTNNSVFSVKNPIMKSDRVQWIQSAYNKYARDRKLFGKNPDWPIISDDSKYGTNTADAMNRLMGKKSVTWAEVKTRTDYLQAQLSGNPFNFNWQ